MKNTVKELNLTISSLEDKRTSLSQKNQELETRLQALNEENQRLNTSLRSEIQKNRELSSLGFIFMTPELKNWTESRQYCRNNGADLVMIKTEEKQSFISSRVNERVWIGLSDADEEWKWKWVDNSTLNQGFWIKGEPNTYLGRNEDCVEIRPMNNNKFWNDLVCSDKNRGVCEKAVE
ncbi:hypothetical protein DNTS_023159 [Danionella cerebrum]|uniref:C-type lectin domain-containing protein n=1 Tax=Danionella cerebrum TaxID=2873325 RepID=A0A553MQV3_9TELE|nr:hypothetical protein DNTS_023159 [Danionella translucida]